MLDPSLRVLVTPPSGHSEISKQAATELGFDIKLSVLPTEALLRKAVSEPDSFDLIQAEYWMINELTNSGVIQPVKASEIDRFHEISPLFINGMIDGEQVSCGGVPPHSVQFADHDRTWLNVIPTICNSDTLGWRQDRLSREVISWGDILAPDLSGRVALADLPAVSYLEVSLACQARRLVDYHNIGQQSREEIDATFEIINKLARKGHFDSLWATYETSIDRMTNGPVALQSLWPPAVTDFKKRKIPVRYSLLKEGARGWAGGFCLSAHLKQEMKARALAYANWYLEGWAGAFLMRQGYYCSTPNAARRFLSENEWNYWQLGLPAVEPIVAPDGSIIGSIGDRREGGSFETRMSRIACWNTSMDEDHHLKSCWIKFRNIVQNNAENKNSSTN